MHNGIRLKVHLVLETTSGERIAEIESNRLYDLVDASMQTSLDLLRQHLETDVASPARGLIQGHILKLERESFPRRDHVATAEVWPESRLVEKITACYKSSCGL
jgi:hypothetical protein